MNDETQQPVIDFLGDAANHGGAPVKRIDTHAAVVFLAGNRVLKVKRAVRFPFLDFSTLGKRRAACEAEIKDQTKATIRVLPDEEFRSPTPPTTCMWCGGPSVTEAVWAKAY